MLDRIGERVMESIIVAILAIVANAIGSDLQAISQPGHLSTELIFLSLTQFGLIMTVIGFAIVTWRDGLLGSIGFLIELASTASIRSGDIAIRPLLFGAT